MRVDLCLTLGLMVSASALAACGDDEGDGASSSNGGGTGNVADPGGAGGVIGGGGAGGIGPVGGAGGVGGDPGPCLATDPACVACGGATCDAPALCCSDGTTPACGDACETDYQASCDGSEDCSTGDCCVSVFFSQNVPDGGTAACGACGTPTGGSASAKSVACRAQSECGGVVGEFGVPYSECCFAPGFDVGLCVSQTAASISFPGACNP